MKRISKTFTMFAVILSFVFVASTADAWWIFGKKKEMQTQPSQSTSKAAQPATMKATGPCFQPLAIETVPAGALKTAHPELTAREQLNNDLLGSHAPEVKFKVTGGKAPYTWSVKSAVEGYFPDAYCDDTSRCMPHMFSITSSGTDEATLSGSFDNSLTYCMSNPEMLDSGEARDPITGYVIFPTVCGPDQQYFGEALTVSVTDSCPTRHTVEQNYAFKLSSPPEKVSDLLAADIRMKGNDTSNDTSDDVNIFEYVEIRAYNSTGQLLTKGAIYGHDLEEDIWHTYRLPFSKDRGDEDINLEDINRITLYMSGRNCYKGQFDVTIHDVMVYSKYRYFYFGPGAPGYGGNIWWEVPYAWDACGGDSGTKTKEENFGRPPVEWKKFNQPLIVELPTWSEIIGP